MRKFDWNSHVGHRFFVREVQKYVSQAQCINTGKVKSAVKKTLNLLKNLVPIDARSEK